MNLGYVKLHRKMLDSPVWQTNYYPQKILAITCLMMANHSAARLSYGGKVIKLEPGQFFTSLKSLEIATRLSSKNLRTSILNLKKLNFLASKPAGKGRIITIMNWHTYQKQDKEGGRQSGKQVASRWQASGRQVATNNNDKNEENERMEDLKRDATASPPTAQQLFYEKALPIIKGWLSVSDMEAARGFIGKAWRDHRGQEQGILAALRKAAKEKKFDYKAAMGRVKNPTNPEMAEDHEARMTAAGFDMDDRRKRQNFKED